MPALQLRGRFRSLAVRCGERGGAKAAAARGARHAVRGAWRAWTLAAMRRLR